LPDLCSGWLPDPSTGTGGLKKIINQKIIIFKAYAKQKESNNK